LGEGIEGIGRGKSKVGIEGIRQRKEKRRNKKKRKKNLQNNKKNLNYIENKN
jgi:hypothetical protein